MNTEISMRQICINNLADQLMRLRGDLSQERMAEKCEMSLRHYSDLERRLTTATSLTMIHLFAVGVDLNRWAEETLEQYKLLCPEYEE